MAEFPCLPLFTDAYLGDTTHLTTIEHGAYLLLLMTAWRSPGCCLPDDDVKLARYCRLRENQWQRIKPVMLEFFTIKDGSWWNGRLSDERSAVQRKRETNVRNGHASALKRHDTSSTVVPTDEQRSGNYPLSLTPEPKPIKDKELNTDRHLGEPIFQEMDIDREFEVFWIIYPKKRAGSKDKAKAAYLRALSRTKSTPKEIYDGTERYRTSDEATREDGRYAKGCAAWLNDDRWKNAYEQQGCQRNNQKASYLDKIAAAGAKALELHQRQLEADREAPWNRDDTLGSTARATAISYRNHEKMAEQKDTDIHEKGDRIIEKLDEDDGWRS